MLLAVAAPAELDPATLSEGERSYLDSVQAWVDQEGGYQHEQQTRPLTLAPGLTDSPVGLLSWIVEKYRAWSDSGGYYRPRYQSRAELYIQTNLLDRFPRGNFGLLTSLAHEYRSSVRFPLPGDSSVSTGHIRTLAFRLEIRIQTAVVSYQFRNVLQERYVLVPGFQMPRQTQFYGVRWDFWN